MVRERALARETRPTEVAVAVVTVGTAARAPTVSTVVAAPTRLPTPQAVLPMDPLQNRQSSVVAVEALSVVRVVVRFVSWWGEFFNWTGR